MTAIEKKVVTRETILDAGERALGRYGYRKLTMQDIAEEAGLGRRTLYTYFDSKQTVCFAIVERAIDRSLDDMDCVLVSRLSGREKLRQVLIVRLSSRIERSLSYHHALNETCRAVYPGLIDDFQILALPDVARIESAIMFGLEDGTLAPCDPKETAWVLVRGTTGFLPSALSPGEVRSLPQLLSRIESFIDVLVRGLTSSGTSQGGEGYTASRST